MDNRKKLKELFQKHFGIVITDENSNDNYLDVSDISSLEFIVFIVDLEQAFGICVDEQFLSMDTMNTYTKLLTIIEEG